MFFDNFNQTHQAGPLLEETHYYPFGLTMGGVSSKAAGALENDKKYNSIELNEDLGLGTYDAFYRTLDPQIGRWWQIDPRCEPHEDEDELSLESLTPYNSMGNEPIRHSDPKGDIFGIDNLIGAAVGALIDYGSQVASNFADGKSFKQSFTQVDGASIAKSAVIGLVTSGVANVAGKVMTKAGSAIVAKLEPAAGKLAQSNVVSKVSQVGSKIIKETGVKLSKVEKSLEKVKVGDKFTKITETKPGIGPGQSRAVYERVKNADGTVIRNTKTSYDRANKVQNIKPKELPKN
ncbi:MAG: hypothetical protein B7Y37_01585 [Sphingobacteriia bacterium 28-36-52]|nr:MAG: hypothetical protein B7Y37_01585 [Sphingobacteriia bacterium 28-36-52]